MTSPSLAEDRLPYLASYSDDEVLLQLLAAEAVPALLHGGGQPPAVPDGSVPHPLLLPPLALPLRRARHKHVIQRVVVAVGLPHHLAESRRRRRRQMGWEGDVGETDRDG